MIYTSAQVDSGAVFGGHVQEDPFDWRSNLPSLATKQFFSITGYDQILVGAAGDELSLSFFAKAAQTSVFKGMRNSMGYVAQAYGYFQSATRALKTFFSPPIHALVKQVTDTVMNAIELAVNSISWVPIVGWILRVLYEVASVIFDIVRSVREKAEADDQKALNSLARQGYLPFAEENPDADTFLGQALQNHILDNNIEWMLQPQFLATGADDFRAKAQRFDGSDCTDGYIIVPKGGGNIVGGLGYMPGSLNIHGAIEVLTHAGGSVRDVGSYLPVTQALAGNLWGQILKGDGGLTFAMDTDRLASQWANYIRAAMEFATDKLGGWSMVGGPLDNDRPENASKFKCTSCDVGAQGCACCRKGGLPKNKDHMKWRTPAGDGHRSAYMEYMSKIFEWKRIDESKGYEMDNIDWDNTAPTRALDNLHVRQEAMITSPKCMYLDDTGQRFKAIGGNTALRQLWRNNVQVMFESGDWKRIDYRDVIPGEDVDQALHTLLANNGSTPAKFFNMDDDPKDPKGRQGLADLGHAPAYGPSVLGDPEPPDPPETADFEPPRRLGSGDGEGRRAGGGAGLLVAGAAAAAYFVLKK